MVKDNLGSSSTLSTNLSIIGLGINFYWNNSVLFVVDFEHLFIYIKTGSIFQTKQRIWRSVFINSKSIYISLFYSGQLRLCFVALPINVTKPTLSWPLCFWSHFDEFPKCRIFQLRNKKIAILRKCVILSKKKHLWQRLADKVLSHDTMASDNVQQIPKIMETEPLLIPGKIIDKIILWHD